MEVTYALDSITCSADNVGFGTWIWRGREFNPHPLSSRSRRVDHQSAARPQSRLAEDAKIFSRDRPDFGPPYGAL